MVVKTPALCSAPCLAGLSPHARAGPTVPSVLQFGGSGRASWKLGMEGWVMRGPAVRMAERLGVWLPSRLHRSG